MNLDLSIRLGELGRPRQFSVEGRWVKLFWTGLVAVVTGFGILTWQVVSAARIYPELLYQTRKTTVLDDKMQRLRKETLQLKLASGRIDSLASRLGGRFGLASAVSDGARTLPDGQKLIERLFPDPSGSEAWSREASDLGERTANLRQNLSRIEILAQAKITQLEQTPSIPPSRGQISSGFGWRLHPSWANT